MMATGTGTGNMYVWLSQVARVATLPYADLRRSDDLTQATQPHVQNGMHLQGPSTLRGIEHNVMCHATLGHV